jgi:hypothetical protein
MKTLLAIALAAAALTIATATAPPVSGVAFAGGGGPANWCGAPVCRTQYPPWIHHRGR